MRAHVQLKDPAALLESLYEPLDTEAWFARVAQALLPALDCGWGVGLSLVDDANRTLIDVRSVGAVAAVYAGLQAAGMQLPDEPYRAIYKPARAIARASQPRTLEQRENGVLREALAPIGVDDAVWAVGEPCAGYRFQMAAPLLANMTLTLRQRDVIRHVRTHLETALRLRVRADDSAPCAVFAGDGSIKYVAPQLSDEDTQQLSHHARTIERASLRAHRDDALLQWQCLVRGRWSLVVQSQGHQGRHYLIYENAPDAARPRAFSALEQRVVELLAQGISTKQVAHELGTSASSASEAASRAMLKLGVCSKADLLALVRALRDADQPLDATNLSAAERAVLHLLRLGYSNTAIADARSTSVRTVANQVASILRKTGTINRHQAASLDRSSTRPNEP